MESVLKAKDQNGEWVSINNKCAEMDR